MRRFTGLIIGLMIIIIILAASIVESSNKASDYARISEVDYKAVVTDEPGGYGKVIITERLTFNVHAASQRDLFWELWRDLPEEYIDGVKVDYKVNYVKQIFEGKPDVIFRESSKLYWDDSDYIDTAGGLGPGKWYHSKGPYDEDNRQYECVLFYVDGLYREMVVFEIEYEMYNASLRYGDCSELYITLFSEDDINYLKSFRGQILFPNEIMPHSGNYYANTYGTDAHVFPFNESSAANPGYHTFSFELNESQLKFKSYNKYIEFALVSYGEDKHIFTRHASVNDYYDDDILPKLKQEQAKYDALPVTFTTVKIFVLLLLSAVTGLFAVYVFGTDKRLRKKHFFYQPAMQMDYFRDIPSDLDASFAGTLTFCKRNSSAGIRDGYAATMLSLVHKGYIELGQINAAGEWSSGNMRIIVKYRPNGPASYCNACGSSIDAQQKFCIKCGHQVNTDFNLPQPVPLTPIEEQYFSLILRHSIGWDIPLAAFQKIVSEDYEYTNSFVNNIKNAIINIGLSQGYFQKAEYKSPKENIGKQSVAFLIIGFLVLLLGNLISYQTRLDLAFGGFFILGIVLIAGTIYLLILSKKYILLTQFGEDEYAKWRALYNFLDSETLMNERTVIELVIWEKYLIYATAFGISEKVIKALQIRCPDAYMSPVLRNPYFRTRGFYHSSRSFRTATRNASYTARSGGHGGYGGGGRGGGGGGGGH